MDAQPTRNTTPAPVRLDADVVVVGARCAGAATARLLALGGLDVVMVDRAEFPSDTLSTHAIARGGMVQLQRWGLLDRVLESGAPQIREVSFHSNGEFTERQIKDRHGVDFLLAPRRHVLDQLLAEAAVDAGADFRPGVSVTDVTRDRVGRVTGVRGRLGAGPIEISASFVVGADGLRSRVARAVGAPTVESRTPGGSTHLAYYPWSSTAIEYHTSDLGFAGVFPTHDQQACVWAITSSELARRIRRRTGNTTAALRALLELIAPDLVDRLVDGPIDAARSAYDLPNQFRQPIGPGWALVGDAGYHRDSITGHGMSDAFRDAELLAEALVANWSDTDLDVASLASYGVERERLARPIFELTCEMAAIPGRDSLDRLQRELAIAIDEHAGELALRPTRVLAPA